MPRPTAYVDDPCLVKGEGITRCSSPGARLFSYRVKFSIGKPLTGEFRAMDRYQAKRLLANRHPEAIDIHVAVVR